MAPKKQVQKMSLGDFLGDQNLGSWADEMEDMPLPYSRTGYGDRRTVSSAAGIGERSYDRIPNREPLPLPTKPPYTSHLGNLPFDATSGDIEDFFSGCEVTNVRIVEDKIERRPKGFGYVEFASVDGLKRALELNGTQFRGRNIKISVADPPKDRPDMGGRELTDWTRKGPLPDLPQQQRRASDRNFRNYDAPDMERGGSRRGQNIEGDGKSRDFGNWERKGPLSPLPGQEPVRGSGKVRPVDPARERKDSPSWGEHRSQDGSRPPQKEFRERPPPVERQPTAADLDNEWRARMRPDAPVKSKTPTPDPSTPSSPSHAPPALATRPKLNLAKRTVSEAINTPTTPSDSKASPFGAARPIDTAAREKELEEKREAAVQQKKEAEEKAREEKKAKEAAAKAAAEKSGDDEEEEGDVKSTNDNGETPAAGRKIEVLQRSNTSNTEGKDDSSRPERANGEERKSRGPPRESREQRGPRDAPKGPRNNSDTWRRKPSGQSGQAGQSGQGGQSNPASPATPTAGPDADGWSTVAPKARQPRGRGTNPTRTAAT